jgi:hypothetical protein
MITMARILLRVAILIPLCGNSQNTAPLAAVMNDERGLGGEAHIKLFCYTVLAPRCK